MEAETNDCALLPKEAGAVPGVALSASIESSSSDRVLRKVCTMARGASRERPLIENGLLVGVEATWTCEVPLDELGELMVVVSASR